MGEQIQEIIGVEIQSLPLISNTKGAKAVSIGSNGNAGLVSLDDYQQLPLPSFHLQTIRDNHSDSRDLWLYLDRKPDANATAMLQIVRRVHKSRGQGQYVSYNTVTLSRQKRGFIAPSNNPGVPFNWNSGGNNAIAQYHPTTFFPIDINTGTLAHNGGYAWNLGNAADFVKTWVLENDVNFYLNRNGRKRLTLPKTQTGRISVRFGAKLVLSGVGFHKESDIFQFDLWVENQQDIQGNIYSKFGITPK